MKKILVMMLCMTLLSGCGNKDTVDNHPNDNTKDNVTDNVRDDLNDAKNDVVDGMENWYNRFETALGNEKVEYSSKSSLDAQSIGGVEGYRYTVDGGNVDVYRFVDGDDFNRIVEEKKINLNGKDTKVEVNDHMIIVSDGVSENILKVFRNLK